LSVILDEIRKAEERAGGLDMREVVAAARGLHPDALADPALKDQRRDFLRSTLDSSGQADRTFERILQGNELQPVSYLARGSIAAAAVARIKIQTAGLRGWGTGFLIAPRVLLTNNHVLPDAAAARRSLAQFRYELDLDDRPVAPIDFAFDADALFETSRDLDFTAIALRPLAEDQATALDFGFLPLLGTTGKALEGEWLTIIQHPNGERKQLCVRENKLIKRTDNVLWYSTDTLAGSSGSPVFNNDWFVVALHHSGVPDRDEAGRYRLADGSLSDTLPADETRIKWIANEGVRASVVAAELQRRRGGDPLLQQMFEATPQSARIVLSTLPAAPVAPPVRKPESKPMSQTTSAGVAREYRLRIEADGTARIVDAGGTESLAAPALVTGAGAARVAAFSAPFDDDYAKRKGYDPAFLGASQRVELPRLSDALQNDAVPLLRPAKAGDVVLKYHGYSLVMHKRRKLAIYSAANIDFGQRWEMSRPQDVWRRDPRIATEYQLEGWYYASNQFDRGHLTRREDMEVGITRKAALISAADTCHWTNCTPQHAKFNQGKTLWQGIERYILERNEDLDQQARAQVITGPVLDEGDPDYRKAQYPEQFWKVVAALDETGKLSATAYLASQKEVVAQFGVEAVTFGAYGTFQVRIAEIERLTGLTFLFDGSKRLSSIDPLEKRPPVRPRRRGAGPAEAAQSGTEAPPGYAPLAGLDDIVL